MIPPTLAEPVARKPTNVITEKPITFQIAAFTTDRLRVSIPPPSFLAMIFVTAPWDGSRSRSDYEGGLMCVIPNMINKFQQM
jgi:hypothetical protein